MTEEELVEAVALEVVFKADQPMKATLSAGAVFQLTGLIQLALRHPQVSSEIRATAAVFLAGVREYFADSPGVLDVIRRGDRREDINAHDIRR
jgi:hypothetical protein